MDNLRGGRGLRATFTLPLDRLERLERRSLTWRDGNTLGAVPCGGLLKKGVHVWCVVA